MTAYRAGQRVRIEGASWAVEGILVTGLAGRLFVDMPGDDYEWPIDEWTHGMSITITVLSEPRPDEPTGLGAVVRDRYDGLWVRTYRADELPLLRPGQCPPWREVLPGTYLEDDATRRHWDQIADPVVVLSDGWTP